MTQNRRGNLPNYLQPHKQGLYKPEYKRLEIDPNATSFLEANKVAQNVPVRSFKIEQSAPKPRGIPRMPSQKIPVHTGIHEDQMWMNEELVQAPKNGRVKVQATIDNNDYVDIEYLQGYDQAKNIPAEQEEPEDSINQTKEDSQVEPGEYVIMINNKMIVTSFHYDEIKEIIEEMVIKDDIAPDNILVYKRLNINFGITID